MFQISTINANDTVDPKHTDLGGGPIRVLGRGVLFLPGTGAFKCQ